MDEFRNFEIEVTDEDYKNIVFFNDFIKEKRMVFIFVCVLFSFFIILTSIGRGQVEFNWTFVLSVCVVGLFIIKIIITQLKIKKFLKTNSSILNIKRKVKICPEYISQSSQDGGEDIIYTYPNIRIAYEISEYFLFSTKSGKTLIIPKRCVKDEDLEYIRTHLSDNLGEDFKVRKRR